MTATTTLPTNPWRIAGWSLLATLLAVPAIAMQFTTEVTWGTLDFVAAAIMLAGLGIGVELIARLSVARRVRIALAAGLVAAFLLVWAELAVGIVG